MQISEINYQRIAKILVEMIPEEWSKVLLYAEVREGYSQVYFYYYPQSKDNPIYSLDIEELFRVDESYHEKMYQELEECCEDLWEHFKSETGQVWTSLTFLLENTGAFKTIYDYEDLSQLSPIDKKHNWEAKYLSQTKGE